MSVNVIAIDGPAASGKSTVAKKIADRFGFTYVNTGSMFRAIAWKALKQGIGTDAPEALEKMLKNTRIVYRADSNGGEPEILIDGENPGMALRTPEISRAASCVSAYPEVRRYTAKLQRKMAKNGFIVMEGRDIGTEIFPDAKYKFFLTASPRIRAIRRLTQDGGVPDEAGIDAVAQEIARRDEQDSKRAVAPLRQAEDAVFIDNSELDTEETLTKICSYIKVQGVKR